ncbi:hypothetical protein SAMN05421665_0238 [Yoonia rosea]|uniref:Uncharacterized protein n=1 Tax=Yoonia rosea TaxID=287098 RepID=A0A1R3WCU0_9RHOB|nr:hypothetical protein SAMN05421665_0238 [Yoonia rosea]
MFELFLIVLLVVVALIGPSSQRPSAVKKSQLAQISE